MRYFFFIHCLIAGIFCNAQTDSATNHRLISLEALPTSTVFPVLTADARSHRLQLLKDLNSPGYIGSLGGQFPLVNCNAFEKTLQFSVAATAYTTLNRYAGRGRIVNIDYFVDFLFDLEWNKKWKIRGGYGHTSQHLSDDAIEAGMVAQNYVKDYVQLHAAHSLFKDRLLIYSGVYYFHNYKLTENSIPFNLSKKIMVQSGLEYDAIQICKWTYYIAGDIKLRQEFDFDNTHSIQTGFKLKGTSGKKFRFAYNFLGGYEERGQFYKTKISLNTIGFYFDF